MIQLGDLDQQNYNLDQTEEDNGKN